MTDTNSAGPDRSVTAAPGAVHERSFFLDVARDVTATVASGTVLALGKAAVDKIREAKHDDGPPPPSGQSDTPTD